MSIGVQFSESIEMYKGVLVGFVEETRCNYAYSMILWDG